MLFTTKRKRVETIVYGVHNTDVLKDHQFFIGTKQYRLIAVYTSANNTPILRMVSIRNNHEIIEISVSPKAPHKAIQYHKDFTYDKINVPPEQCTKEHTTIVNGRIGETKRAGFGYVNDKLEFYVVKHKDEVIAAGDQIHYKDSKGRGRVFTVLVVHDKAIFGQDDKGEPRMIKYSDFDALHTLGIKANKMLVS